MIKVTLDFERLKHPNTGLYFFCKELGNAILGVKDNFVLPIFYLPKKLQKLFLGQVRFKNYYAFHKILLSANDTDIWHITSQSSVFVPFQKDVKFVLTIHDLNYLIEKKHHISKIEKYKQRIQKNIDSANVVTCISNFVANQVREHFQLGEKTIKVIYNGCNHLQESDACEPKYKPSSKFLFAIGTMLPKKNFHTLIPLLVDNDYELILAGNWSSKHYVQKIREEAIKYNVANRVHLVGSIAEGEKIWYYCNCLAFVFPSLAEGFGLPVIEAMQFGKPIFLSKETSLPEIGGDVCYYFDNFEPQTMQRCFREGMQHYHLLANTNTIKQSAKDFSWENSAKAYLEIYKSI